MIGETMQMLGSPRGGGAANGGDEGIALDARQASCTAEDLLRPPSLTKTRFHFSPLR